MRVVTTRVRLPVVVSLFVVTPARAQNTPQKVEQKRAANIQTLYGLLFSAESVLVGGPESAQASSLFAPGVTRRISPLAVANDLTEVRNYFFGVTQSVIGYSDSRAISSFRALVPRDDRVWVDVDIALVPNPGSPVLHSRIIRQVGFFRFNANNQIVSFDLTMPNFGAANEALGLLTPGLAAGPQNGVCQLHATYCGSFPQYADEQACVSFLQQSIPVGTFDRVSSNSTVCRAFHASLTPFSPETECPNLGMSGGSECQNLLYDDYFTPIF